MERADGEIGTERFSLYNQIEQKLVNNVAWLSIDQSTSSYLLKPYVSGFSYNIANQTPPNDWGHIYILAH
jgi:oligopeptide transport system substrate-binding protein